MHCCCAQESTDDASHHRKIREEMPGGHAVGGPAGRSVAQRQYLWSRRVPPHKLWMLPRKPVPDPKQLDSTERNQREILLGRWDFVTIKLQAFFSPFAPSKAKRTPCGLPFLRDLFLTCVNYNNRQTFVFWTWSDEAAFDCFYSTTWLSGYNTSIRQRRKVSVAKAVQENKCRSWLPDGTSMLCTGNQTEH